MKLMHCKTFLTLAALFAGGVGAFAQSNGVPGPTEYTKFSQFVTERNIFDPTRTPRYRSSGYKPPTQPNRFNRSAPALALVGTMSYEKGKFAFFNGNTADLKLALQVTQKIAGYTIVEISPNRVKLETADKNHQFEMTVGDAMRQENGKWVFGSVGDLPSETGATESSGSGNATPASPASGSEPNEILKRLMQLREKENQ